MFRWLAIPAVAFAAMGPAAAEPIRIMLLENPAEAESPNAEQGFRLGLDYATKGTHSINGRAIDVTVFDGSRIDDSHVDLTVNLSAALAPEELLDAAAASKSVLVLARGDAAPALNRYVFRTAYTASQLALACVAALGFPELNLFAVAPDTPGGHASVLALKEALERIPRGVFYAGATFIRTDETDIGAAVSTEYDGLHYLHGAKTLLMLWDRGPPPVAAIGATNPGQFGVRLALCGNMDPRTPGDPQTVALEGVTSYFYALTRNSANDWLIAHASETPDEAMVDGMDAAIAVVTALAGAASNEKDALISSFEGLRFETPKGRMIIEPGNHQASQAMYQFRIDAISKRPELVREIGAP